MRFFCKTTRTEVYSQTETHTRHRLVPRPLGAVSRESPRTWRNARVPSRSPASVILGFFELSGGRRANRALHPSHGSRAVTAIPTVALRSSRRAHVDHSARGSVTRFGDVTHFPLLKKRRVPSRIPALVAVAANSAAMTREDGNKLSDDSALWNSLNEDDFFKDIVDGDGAVDGEGVDGFADVWDALDRNQDLLPPSLGAGIEGNAGKSSGPDVIFDSKANGDVTLDSARPGVDSARPGVDSAAGDVPHAPVIPEGRQERHSTDDGSNDAGSRGGSGGGRSVVGATADSAIDVAFDLAAATAQIRAVPESFARSTANARSPATPHSKTRHLRRALRSRGHRATTRRRARRRQR